MRRTALLFLAGAALMYWVTRPVEAQLIFSKSIPPIGIGGGSFSGGGGVSGSCGTANALGKFTASTTLACATSIDNGTTITNTEVLLGPSGGAGAPTYSFSASTNSGIYACGSGWCGSVGGTANMQSPTSATITLGGGSGAGVLAVSSASNSQFTMGAAGCIGWSATAVGSMAFNTASDSCWFRDHAGGQRYQTTAAAPTATSCGTSPSVAGNDSDGIITVGTTPSTTCTLTFTGTWGAAPVCVALDYNTAETIKGVPGTTSWPMTFSATLTAADTIGYHCVRAN